MTAQVEGDPPGSAGPDAGRPTTFHGTDPDTTAAAAICESTPTSCQARTRLYRHGVLERQGFPVEDISEYIADESAVVWLDLRDPDRDDLNVLSAEFGLHPVAIEDALYMHERPKLDRYRSHLFLAAYAVHLDQATGELSTSELAAFVTERALITVRKDDGLDIGAVVGYWDASSDLAKLGGDHRRADVRDRPVRHERALSGPHLYRAAQVVPVRSGRRPGGTGGAAALRVSAGRRNSPAPEWASGNFSSRAALIDRLDATCGPGTLRIL
jgi:hypothetical protein